MKLQLKGLKASRLPASFIFHLIQQKDDVPVRRLPNNALFTERHAATPEAARRRRRRGVGRLAPFVFLPNTGAVVARHNEPLSEAPSLPERSLFLCRRLRAQRGLRP